MHQLIPRAYDISISFFVSSERIHKIDIACLTVLRSSSVGSEIFFPSS